MLLKKSFLWGPLFVSVRDCLCELSWPRRLSHSVHASGCIGQVRLLLAPLSLEHCWWCLCVRTVCPLCVLAPLSSCRTKDNCHAHDEHKDNPHLVYPLACPRIAHGHTPAAALDRSTSSFEPGESCFPQLPTRLLLARSRTWRAELYHRDHSDYRVSLRSDRAKPTISVTLFDCLYCLNC